jgi:carbonic anhydrase
LDKLAVGYRKFRAEIFPRRQKEFHLLAEGQQPEWLFISCSDSRVVPDLVLGTDPGDLFITRNAGNVIPMTGNDVDGCTATIEYAIEVLQVRHAILCGHSDCGAIKAIYDHKFAPDSDRMPHVHSWLSHVEQAFEHQQPLDPADGDAAGLASLIRGNVVAQLGNLKAQPSVARALAEGRLTVRGWYYDILTGRMEEYDEELGRFRPWQQDEISRK